jgi:hypothetical protein
MIFVVEQQAIFLDAVIVENIVGDTISLDIKAVIIAQSQWPVVVWSLKDLPDTTRLLSLSISRLFLSYVSNVVLV